MSLPTWLFVSYGGGHVKALLPVALQARAMGWARPVFLALTTAAAEVRASGLETLGFADCVEPGDEEALRQGERLAADLQVQAAQARESAAYLGLSYADLVQRLGAKPAAEAYARYGRQAFLPLSILERLIRRLQPALVLATNSPRAEQAAIQTARQLGVPSLCLLDLFGLWERERLVRADYADALCVLNDAVRQTFVDAGRPADSVHVTGNPAFEGLDAPQLRVQGQAWRREAGWEHLHVLLYASSPEPTDAVGVAGRGDPALPRSIERHLLEAVRAQPNLALWVRRHPSEAPADEVEALQHPRIRVARGPLHAYLQACDEVVVTVSTVGVEAQLAGRRVTQVRGSVLDGLSPYLAMGIAARELAVADLPRPGVFAALGATAAPAGERTAHHVPTPQASATATATATTRVLDVARQLVAQRHQGAAS